MGCGFESHSGHQRIPSNSKENEGLAGYGQPRQLARVSYAVSYQTQAAHLSVRQCRHSMLNALCCDEANEGFRGLVISLLGQGEGIEYGV